MSKHCMKFKSISCLLKSLIGKKVTLILEDCCELKEVRIKCVRDNLVLVKHCGECRYINIDCICQVIPICECECECD